MNLRLPEYNTMTYSQAFPTFDGFYDELKATPFYTTAFSSKMTEELLKINYVLLYNKYGNSPIANRSLDQFKSKLFGLIWTYGPNWAQKLQIQDKLRSLGIDDSSDIYKGSKAIYNHAFNPETAPSTSTLEEITYINDQNTTNYKRSRLEGLSQLMDLLSDSFTDDYINKFRKLFKTFVNQEPIVYVGVEDI